MLSPSQRERQREADLTKTLPGLEPERRRWLGEMLELAHPQPLLALEALTG
jgi:hypothetical protein